MCLKGGQGVGKSALRTQYIEGSFVEAYVEQDENDTFRKVCTQFSPTHKPSKMCLEMDQLLLTFLI